MQRGELYLVRKPGSRDPKKQRVFALVGRQLVIDSKFTTVICAPVYSRHDGLSTQVKLGPEYGLKQESSIHCDELVSLPKTMLTRYLGRLDGPAMLLLDGALATALDLNQAAW
jgi:mRNA interferase MazF